MSSVSSLMRIALTGIDAAQTGLATVGNNIANANTPGYSLETVNQSAQVPAGQDGVVEGTGVQVTGIQRNFSQFAENRLWQTTAMSGAASQLQSSLNALNNVMSSSSSSLGPSLSNFFQAIQTLSSNPSGAAERQAALSSASSLSNTFNSLAGAIGTQRKDLSQQLTSTVDQINTLTGQIAKLNVQIGASSGNTSGNQPNGLLDQRDQLITQLSKLVGVSTVTQPNGALSVFTANGQTLVAGAKAYQLGTKPNSLNAQNLDVVYVPSGAVVSNGIQGGQLSGLIAARTQLDQATNGLGQIAVVLANAVNHQQSLGLDANGNLGQPIFSVPAPSVQAASTNSGGALLSATVSNPSAVTANSYELSYQGGAWTALTYPGGASVGVTTSGSTLSFGGMTVNVNGTPANGDRFLVSPVSQAAAAIKTVMTDPNGIAAAAPYVASPGTLSSAGLVDSNTGNVTISAGQATTSPASGATMIPAGDFGQPLTVSFTSSGSYQVSDPAGVIASGAYNPAAGANIAVAYPSPPGPAGTYWQVSLNGSTPHAGDSYTLQPSGPGDNRNATAMSALAQAPLVGGSASLSQAYATLTGQIGSAGQQAKLSATSAQAAATQAQNAQQSISGVNMNEEAAKLLQYQQAFQAAAKSIQTADKLFQDVLAI